MRDPMTFSAARHYDTRIYERVRELECGCENGMTPAEVYEAEAEVVLDQLGPLHGGLILDVACGGGLHALAMSDHLAHRVAIRGFDIAPTLIEEAQARLDARRAAGVGEDVAFAVADVLERETWPLGDAPVDAVTCIGDSFGYHTNSQTRRILRHFFEVLRPEGKMVMQFRERDPRVTPLAPEQALGFVAERRLIDGVEREVCCDPRRGDVTYDYDIDCPHPDPLDGEGYVALDDRGVRFYRDRDGWDYGAFARVYLDGEGASHHFAPVWMVRSFTTERPFAGLSRVLSSLGFAGVALATGRTLGTRRNVAVVATRPRSQ